MVERLPAYHCYEIPAWTKGIQWVAVIGARTFLNPDWERIARAVIEERLESLDLPWISSGIVSGGADGIDSLGEKVADHEWIKKCIILPKNKVWEPEGYKARNEMVIEVASWVVAIRCESTKSWGTGHAAELADSLGKPVERYVIHKNSRCTGCVVDPSWKGDCGA